MTVQEWIKAGCNYDEGVQLLAKLDPRNRFSDFLKGDPRFKDRPGKLKYELLKLQNVPVAAANPGKPKPKPTPAPAANKPKALVNPTLPQKLNIESHSDQMIDIMNKDRESKGKHTAYPETVQSAIDLLSSLWKKRSVLWEERLKLGWENTPELKEKRRKMSDKIIDIGNQMEHLYKVKEDFEKNGIVPEQNVALQVESAQTEELPNSVDELKKLKKNLQTNNSKDSNLLMYQSKASKKRKTPMPDGPNRLKIENRIDARNKRIEEIDDKLKALKNEKQ